MKKLANLKYKLIIWTVVFLAYTGGFFIFASLTKRGIDKSFVATYFYMAIPLLVLLLTFFLDSRKKVFGAINALDAPTTIVYGYVCVMFVISTILGFFNFDGHILFISTFMVLLSCLFLILYIASFKQAELINKTPNKMPIVMSIEQLPTTLRDLFDRTKEPNTKLALDRLIEVASITDGIVPTEEVKEIEKSIFENVNFLKLSIEKDDYANAHNYITKVNELLEKRAAKVK